MLAIKVSLLLRLEYFLLLFEFLEVGPLRTQLLFLLVGDLLFTFFPSVASEAECPHHWNGVVR